MNSLIQVLKMEFFRVLLHGVTRKNSLQNLLPLFHGQSLCEMYHSAVASSLIFKVCFPMDLSFSIVLLKPRLFCQTIQFPPSSF